MLCCNNGRLRPLRDATSVVGDSLGDERVLPDLGFLPGKAQVGALIRDSRPNVTPEFRAPDAPEDSTILRKA